MTAAEIQEVLDLISYKDWDIVCAPDGDYLQVQFCACGFAHVYPCTKRLHGRKWRLSPWMTRSEVVQTALKAVLAAEEHEAREKFTYKGRAVFGPHLDVEALVAIVDAKLTDERPNGLDSAARV